MTKGDLLESIISNDALVGTARRTELAMEFLSIMSDHDAGDGGGEISTAEAVAVLIATTSYLCVEFGIPELKLISDVKRFHKMFTKSKKILGPRSTARDNFTEIAVMTNEPKSKKTKR